ncbi:helix-turn-helix domain-containing protein [Streptomyces sp. NPDC004327]|uniref:helix-turn-helix domain-containing protein n=1 Tax=Streptomyces sp. NPDC004327 TaxID=3364699 RepID=UPI00369951AA
MTNHGADADGGGGPVAGVDALAVLEMLARRDAPERFSELLDQADAAGVPPAERARLERAVQLADGVARVVARRERCEIGLDALSDTARDLTLPYDLEGLLRTVLRRAKRVLELDLACLTLRGDAHGVRVIHASEGSDSRRDPADWAAALDGDGDGRLGGGLSGLAQLTGEPVWTEDYLKDQRFPHVGGLDQLVRDEGMRAVVAVPLRAGDTVIGLLYGADRRVRRYSPGEVGLISSLADLAAVATEKAGLLDQTRAEVTELERDSSRVRTALTRMRHLGEAHGRIMNLILAGGDLLGVAKATGDALDACVLIRDPGGRTLASTGEIAELDEDVVAKASLDAHASRRPVLVGGGPEDPAPDPGQGPGRDLDFDPDDDGDLDLDRDLDLDDELGIDDLAPYARWGLGRTRQPQQGPRTWIAPVIAGSEDLGVLVVRAATALSGEDERLLELAAQSVALLILMQRSTAVAEGPVRDELLDDLLAEPQHAPQQIAQRARRLGIDLRKPHVVVVARPEGGEQGRAVVWASSYAYRMSGLKTVQGGSVVLLLPGVDASAAAKAVAGELAPLLGHPVSVGAAGPGWSPDGVGRLFQEAMRCLDAMSALGGAGAAASAEDLGFLGLLLSDHHDVDGFVESAVGPVLDYDAERDTDLVRTLEAYFASGGSPTNAAEALHVHPNTVSRRLERIGELLGPEWQKPGQVLEVQLALRLQRTKDVLARRRAALAEQRPTAGPACADRPGA